MRLPLPLIVGAALGLGGCGLPTASPCVPSHVRPNTAALTRDLNAARARWQSAGTANYTYTLRFTGFAPVEPITVTVHNGVVTTSPADRQGPGTVEDMFTLIAQQIAGVTATDCMAVSATYDPADGHPTGLSWAIEQRAIADGFGGWQVTAFTPQS